MSALTIDAQAAAGLTGPTSVTVELTDQRSDAIIGFITDTDVTIVNAAVFTTDANGFLVIDLVPTADITPGNSCYTVTVGTKAFLIQKSGAEQNLLEALVPDPGELDPVTSAALLKANDLSDLTDVADARFHLGLGNSATRDVGTTAGTVAAGDDPRFGTIVTDHNDLTGRSDPNSHPGTAISTVASGFLTTDNVQDNITEIVAEVEQNASDEAAALAAHINDTTDAHDASAISVVPVGTISSTDVQTAIAEINSDTQATDAALQAHLVDLVDAHDASAISYVPTGTIASTDVQTAVAEVATDAASSLATHVTNPTGAHAATAISFAPAGDIVATTVQAAVVEVDAEFHAHEVKTPGAHAATAISFSPTGNIAATDVQSAIAEVATDAAGLFVPKVGTYAATTTDVLTSRVTGNANDRLVVNADGLFEWGDGTAVTDVTLQRSSTFGLAVSTGLQASNFRLGAAGATWTTGSGTPEGSVTAPIGSVYSRTTAGAGLVWYVKESGAGNTGWIASGAPLAAHLANGTGAHAASAISFTAGGTIAATDVQAAIAEVALEKVAKAGDAMTGQLTNTANIIAQLGGAATQVRIGNAGPSLEAGMILGSAFDTSLYRSASNALMTPGSLAVVGGISMGATPATAGDLRFTNNQGLRWRNAANTGNGAATIMFVSTSDDTFIQADTGKAVIIAPGGTVTSSYSALSIVWADATNLVVGTTTGTKFGTATTQKLGFWNATPIVQPSTTGTLTGFTANASANTTFNESTFTGNTGTKAYTISDVVRALKLSGLMAAS